MPMSTLSIFSQAGSDEMKSKRASAPSQIAFPWRDAKRLGRWRTPDGRTGTSVSGTVIPRRLRLPYRISTLRSLAMLWNASPQKSGRSILPVAWTRWDEQRMCGTSRNSTPCTIFIEHCPDLSHFFIRATAALTEINGFGPKAAGTFSICLMIPTGGYDTACTRCRSVDRSNCQRMLNRWRRTIPGSPQVRTHPNVQFVKLRLGRLISIRGRTERTANISVADGGCSVLLAALPRFRSRRRLNVRYALPTPSKADDLFSAHRRYSMNHQMETPSSGR